MNAPELHVREHVPLAPRTTFGVGGPARYFILIDAADQIPSAVRFARDKGLPFHVLGGGSNVVVSDEGVRGVVLCMAGKGITLLEENPHRIRVNVAAGENWDRFVAYCVERGWWGVENLSWIPGTVGAVPVQNVGAYGQEAADTVESVDVWDTRRDAFDVLSNRACSFGYRSSLFNTTEAGRHIITSVTFVLTTNGRPCLSYALVRDRVEKMMPGIWPRARRSLRRHLPRAASWLDALPPRPAIQSMREAIVGLRTDGRLPDVAVTGNAGSFFKNVRLSPSAFDALVSKVNDSLGAEAAGRIQSEGARFAGPSGYKLPAGVLVKLCGLSGARYGGAALHPTNPTILINENGQAKASDIKALATAMIASVEQATGLRLHIEPQALGMAWP